MPAAPDELFGIAAAQGATPSPRPPKTVHHVALKAPAAVAQPAFSFDQTDVEMFNSRAAAPRFVRRLLESSEVNVPDGRCVVAAVSTTGKVISLSPDSTRSFAFETELPRIRDNNPGCRVVVLARTEGRVAVRDYDESIIAVVDQRPGILPSGQQLASPRSVEAPTLAVELGA